ncbi:MAG: helix-turn-helix domain-containing protein [Nitrospirae bacterium]|nr:helix-turn-helix domain-containing protein [Candidatus Manganitrophaceae bacterium]
MENLGEYLQQKREEQDISIDELVSLTRIPIRFIEAIESNQFDLLPNQVTAKGFLRSYAECVGVDHGLITEAFVEFPAPDSSFSDARSRNEILSHVRVEKSSRLPFPRRIVLSIVVLVCVLLILVGLLSKKDKRVNLFSSAFPPQLTAPEAPDIPDVVPPPLSEAGRSEVEVPSSEEETRPLEPETVLSEENADVVAGEPVLETDETKDLLIAAAPSPMPESESSSEPSEAEMTEGLVDSQNEETRSVVDLEVREYVLSLEAIEASWVQVTIDGEEVREALLQPQDIVEWKANKKFRLTLGNAGGVRVKLDGRELPPFGPSGEVVHKDIIGESPVELD